MTRMVTGRRLPAITLAVFFLLLPGVQVFAGAEAPAARFSDQVRQPGKGIRAGCSAASAYALLGQPLNEQTLQAALQKSGASSVRVLHGGSLRDLSYASMRLSVEVDPVGVISALTCG